MIRSILCATVLACVAAPMTASEPTSPLFSWFAGCWQTPDGTSREVWSPIEGQYLFGYNVSYAPPSDPVGMTRVGFFEHMRIELAVSGDVPGRFSAYPAGEGPSHFEQVRFGDRTVTFESAAHDFPQRIRYWRDGENLKAEISTLDYQAVREFLFIPCQTE
ncbi:MAG: DUF6265 family protein [Pseudomonadota bacterium]